MAYQFTSHAGWSRNDNTWAYDITFKINNAETFEIGKEFYTLKLKLTTPDGKYGEFISKYYPVSNNDLPALYLFGEFTVENITDILFSSDENGFASAINIKRTTTNIDNIVNATTHNDYGSWVDFVYNQANGRLFYGTSVYYEWGNSATIEIDADFPIFMPTPKFASGSREISHDNWYVMYTWDILGIVDDGTCNMYLSQFEAGNFSNINKAVNYYSVANEIPANKVWDILNYLKVDGTITESKAYNFRILPDAKIGLYVDERINGDGTPNMYLRISRYPCYVKNFYAPDSTYTEVSSVDSDYWWGDWTDYEDGTSYIGYGATNIPIYRSEADLQKYFDGELGIEDSINGGGSSIKTSTIGDDLQSTDIPTVNLATSGVGCYTYAVSEAQLKEIMSNYLFTTDANLQQSIKDALWTWGNNPIDFMIDCYYVPFSISAFYDTINANLKFGTYQFPNTSYPAVKESNGNRLTLFNTTFEGVYGDWRDYTQFTYDLYLPFVGFFTLDNYKYLNHTVKCEMMFDLSTHNVRYYLFVDGIITDRVDGSVGVNIPLMSTDTVNKAKHDRDTKYGLVTDALSVAGTVGELAAGDISGVSSGINKVVSGIKKYEELKTKPSSSVEGSFSSSMNIYDISYAYLRITEKQLILPDKLNQLYNYPSYYMGSASQLSGYCEISDIRLSGFTGTVDEMEALKRDLMEGVIL